MFRVDNRGSPVTEDEFIVLCLPRSSANESDRGAWIQVSQDTGGSRKMLFYFYCSPPVGLSTVGSCVPELCLRPRSEMD